MNWLKLAPYIGGAVLFAGVSGMIYYQNTRIHHFHVLYDDQVKVVAQRDATIKGLTDAQNNQTSKSEQNVIKVIQGPKEVQSIIREIHSAPVQGPCVNPSYSDEVKNAF